MKNYTFEDLMNNNMPAGFDGRDYTHLRFLRQNLTNCLEENRHRVIDEVINVIINSRGEDNYFVLLLKSIKESMI